MVMSEGDHYTQVSLYHHRGRRRVLYIAIGEGSIDHTRCLWDLDT